ncbi:GlxA family transcriptional regulator [Kalamiella sp. sgz302252]|uniref:GlxA family transcriptional regulator n=1 Tax=Pantoea sp. sgz302252 TaxID=3341827 RepID=UPI0036D2BD46
MSVISVAVIATSGFSTFHFSIPCLIFGRLLNDEKRFDLQICAEQPGSVQSDIGLVTQVENGLEVMETADIIVVPWWRCPEETPSAALLAALVRARQRGADIVGLCLGAYVLAWAGLLEKRRAVTHWEFEQDFSGRFPDVQLETNSLYVDDDRLITSAGTAAGIDCCLYLVRKHYGSAVANRAARRMVIPPYREGGQAQFIARPVPETTRDSNINSLLDCLRQTLHQPHNLDTMANTVGMSRRSFTRHFFRATGMTPAAWLNLARLQRSQELLETTGQSIDAIAQLSGFSSAVTFRQRFRAAYGVNPGEWRRAFCGVA